MEIQMLSYKINALTPFSFESNRFKKTFFQLSKSNGLNQNQTPLPSFDRSTLKISNTKKILKKISVSAQSSDLTEAKTVSDDTSIEEEKIKSDEYSSSMQKAMGDNDLIYRHELGINYAKVVPGLIVGSCLQKAEDVDFLKENANVESILCLQQDSDLQYFGLDIKNITDRVNERNDVKHIRCEIRDFDPFSLRMQLPEAIAKLHHAITNQTKNANAYIHCTAGLGRAPAVALAYMHWMLGYELKEANEILQKVRRCSPKIFAIRAATCDILTNNDSVAVDLVWRNRGVNKVVEVAGLDIGWHNKLPLEYIATKNIWKLNRNLPIGTYEYKYIIDGKWSYNPDSTLTNPDNGSVNNYIDVITRQGSEEWLLRKRLMEEDSVLSEEERKVVKEKIISLAKELYGA